MQSNYQDFIFWHDLKNVYNLRATQLFFSSTVFKKLGFIQTILVSNRLYFLSITNIFKTIYWINATLFRKEK